MKNEGVATIYQLGSEKLTETLNKAGYNDIFEIVSENLTDFSKKNNTIPESDIKQIYKSAKERVENLQMLVMAWQLHNDPVTNNIKKLGADSGLEDLQAALERSLGSGADFDDLFPERSTQGYAEITSIQSLFSPGRYLAVLYNIATQLKPIINTLNIDSRRPDLKSLTLSTANMNKEVSTLDILLDVLQENRINSNISLKDVYHPLTLPYDDDLVEINTVAEVQGTSLINIWDALLDKDKEAFISKEASARSNNKSFNFNSQERVIEPVFSEGGEFYLRTNNQTIYVGNRIATQNSFGLHMHIGTSQALSIPGKFQLVKYSNASTPEQTYLRIAKGEVFQIFNETTRIDNCYMTSDNGQSSQTRGNYCQMFNRDSHEIPQVGLHLPVEIQVVSNNSIKIYVPGHGYIGQGDTLSDNWRNPLALNLPIERALTFTLTRDISGNNIINIKDIFPPTPTTKPIPVTRERLALTPNSFSLLVKQNTTVEELANHFGVSSSNATDLATQLSSTDTFTRKAGISLNKGIELTGQNIYSNTNSQNRSRFIRFGATQNSPVTEYGANFLNSKETTPLWVDSEQKLLNFTESNVVNLASRVEKLIRLSNSTGLRFEQLDWLIVNASDAILEHGREVILDSSVLTAIAEFVRLKHKYHISLDKYVTFFGKVNIYAEVGQDSFYKSTFSTADNTKTIPLGATIRFSVSEQGLNESICCGALRVTADEFLRIGAYCFGDNVTTITVNEENMARLYRLGKIPHMLGLSFTEAERLWKLMEGGEDTLLRQIGDMPTDLKVLDIIKKTEVLLNWMDDYQLDVSTLQAMVTDEFSGTATPELYNFLFKAYEALKGVQATTTSYNKEVKCLENLYRLISTDFNLKPNVMTQVINWLEKTNTEFTFQEYLEKIETFFSTEHKEPLVDLEQSEDLVFWSQLISQYVLIVQWCGLSEQDLLLIVSNPEQLINGQNKVPKPSLYLLKILSRLKEWQQRVKVPYDEAMRYLSQANNKDMTTEKAIKLLSNIHGWNETFTASMVEYLYKNKNFPKNFEQVFTIERWVNLGEQFKIGSRTLGDLVTMAEEDAVAETSNLIESVAQSFMASVKGE